MAPAPIVLFVYNRPWHTEQTLEALSKNVLANESTLYVYADGPKDDSSALREQICETRSIVRKKKWCKEVVISEHASNLGLAKSVIYGITEVLKEHEKIIVLEDDIMTSPVFLQFLNVGLDYYKDVEEIAGISAFAYPCDLSSEDVYFLPIGCSWGWATWKRQWMHFELDADILIDRIARSGRIDEFDFGGYNFSSMLRKQKDGLVDSWAIRFYASFFLKRQCFAYPATSLVRNIGFDASGTHTKGPQSFFETTLSLNHGNFRGPVFDRITKSVEDRFRKQYTKPAKRLRPQSFRDRIRSLLKSFLGTSQLL